MRRFAFVTVFIAFMASSLFAQNPPLQGPMKLTLKRAIEVALVPEGNAQIQLSAQEVAKAKAHADHVHSDLMPELDLNASVQSLSLNLAALGLPTNISINGLRLSNFSGTYALMQPKFELQQKIFDFSLRERVKAARTAIGASEADEENTRDQIAGQVAKLYLWASRVDAKVAAANANLSLAETLQKRAQDRQALGTGLAVDTARAGVELASARQQVLLAENERMLSRLNLLKAINMDFDATLDLTDSLDTLSLEMPDAQHALDDAYKHRADYRAQEAREERARSTYRAGELEKMPFLAGVADYGAAGTSFANISETYTVGLSLRVPIFNGGRLKTQAAENLAAVRQEEIRTKDVRRQIEFDIKYAFGELQNAQLQVTTAEEGLSEAQTELTHATQRYDEGVANNLEITDAQDRIAKARDNRTEALFNLNAAKIDLMVAMGVVRDRL